MQLHRRVIPLVCSTPLLFVGLLATGLVAFSTGCDVVNIGGGDLSAPADPSGLEADADQAEVVLNWDAVGNADSYNVYRATSSTEAGDSPLDSNLTSTSYTDQSVENGTTYYYRVTAVRSENDETAESEGSNEVQGTPFLPPVELEAITSNSKIELNWSAAAGAATYGVYRSTSSTEDVSEMDSLTSDASEAQYVDNAVENGTTYYYRVTSINPEDQESSASDEVVRTAFAPPPDRP